MKKPDLPCNETQRLETLRSLDILDTNPAERFDRVTRLGQKLFNVPICLVSLIDADRQWFKSCMGLSVRETSRDISFCGHTILKHDVLVVEDALKDERFFDNPLVTGEPYIRFYAGFPLKMPDETYMGTLCIIDKKPRTFSDCEMEALKDLGAMVEQELVSLSLATMDELTGITNRRGVLSLGNKALTLSNEQGLNPYLLYFDLDNFKAINDQYGHQAGDEVLKAFSRIMTQVLIDSDVFGRIGGDEFVALISGHDEQSIQSIFEQFKVAVSQFNQQGPYLLEFSYGFVAYNPQKHFDLVELISDADKKMLAHKRLRKHTQ